MKYQIALKKTYKDNTDVDEFFFLSRTEDITLSKILEIEGYDLPKTDMNLSNAINRINEILVALDRGFEVNNETVNKLQEVYDSINAIVLEHSDTINEVQVLLQGLQQDVSNQGNYVGRLASMVAEQEVIISRQSAKIDDLEVKSSLHGKSIQDIQNDIESLREAIDEGGNSGTTTPNPEELEEIKTRISSLEEDMEGVMEKTKINFIEASDEQIRETWNYQRQSNN